MEKKIKAALLGIGFIFWFLLLSIGIGTLIQAEWYLKNWDEVFRAWWFGVTGVICFLIFLFTYHENI